MPPGIAVLDRDRRGYPVPYIVLKDNDGNYQFAINDLEKTWNAVTKNLCHICGEVLEPNPWFTGGPGSALLNGDIAVYHDGPMHSDCMHYALKVCPHLAQVMTHSLNLDPIKERLDTQGIGTWDNTVIPGIPEIFVAVQSWRFDVKTVQEAPEFHVRKPFKKIEYWQKGQMIDKQKGEKLAKQSARELAARIGLKGRRK
jgi:hypothetical protein